MVSAQRGPRGLGSLTPAGRGLCVCAPRGGDTSGSPWAGHVPQLTVTAISRCVRGTSRSRWRRFPTGATAATLCRRAKLREPTSQPSLSAQHSSEQAHGSPLEGDVRGRGTAGDSPRLGIRGLAVGLQDSVPPERPGRPWPRPPHLAENHSYSRNLSFPVAMSGENVLLAEN